MNWYTVSKSPIHGVGVFATARLPRFMYVGQMNTHNVGKVEQFTDLPTVGVIEDGLVWVPLDGFPLWAVNYSDNPNVAATTYGVYALRAIKPGEELTIEGYKR